jgi:hypothetical protein
MRDGAPTAAEDAFFGELARRVPGVHDWYHCDPNGTRWMTASYDFVVGGWIRATLRVDYDGASLRGGWSPACLNWDDGVRAEEALIDTSPPDGLHLDGLNPHAAAAAAATWFHEHIARSEPAAT